MDSHKTYNARPMEKWKSPFDKISTIYCKNVNVRVYMWTKDLIVQWCLNKPTLDTSCIALCSPLSSYFV